MIHLGKQKDEGIHMFGKKRDEPASPADAAKDASKPDGAPGSVASQPAVSRPALNPEIARRGPDMSMFAPRRDSQTTPPPAGQRQETDHKKLIVGRDIFLNGEIRTCDTLVVEGKVEAVLSDCRNIEIAGAGEFKGAAEVENADISGRFDGDLTCRGRLTIRTTGKVLGKIRYGQLETERGGIISGQIEALPDAQGAEGDHATTH